MQGAEHLGCRLIDTVEQRLGGTLEDRQGSAQFVGNVGDQVAAQLIFTVEVIGHLIERFSELAQLARTVLVDTGGTSTGRELTRGGGECGHRAGDPHRHIHGDDQRDHRGERHAEHAVAGQGVADVTLRFHRFGGKAQHHCADVLTVDVHGSRHRVTTGSVDRRETVHLHHHRGERIRRGSDHLPVGIDHR